MISFYVLFKGTAFIVVDMVNDSIGDVAFAARGQAPLLDAMVSLFMSTTITFSEALPRPRLGPRALRTLYVFDVLSFNDNGFKGSMA